MNEFFCNGKKGFCQQWHKTKTAPCCDDCQFFDGKGGKTIKINFIAYFVSMVKERVRKILKNACKGDQKQ